MCECAFEENLFFTRASSSFTAFPSTFEGVFVRGLRSFKSLRRRVEDWGPYNKDSYYLGYYVRVPIFGNSYISSGL